MTQDIERNFTRVTGDTINIPIQIIRLTGCPKDLTGWVPEAEIKSDFTGSLLDKFNVTVSGSNSDGTFVHHLSGSQSLALGAGVYVVQGRITSGSDTFTYWRGEYEQLNNVIA